LPRFARNDEVIDGQLFCLERDDIGLHVLNGPATERGPGPVLWGAACRKV